MNEKRWTIGELAKSGAEVLAKRNLDSPRLDSDLLLAHVLGMARLDLFARFDMPVDDELRAQFRALIKRRLNAEPIAYILGVREFLDLTFEVGPGVLIPRPETEHVVHAGATFLDKKANPKILEIGVGSGCIALSLLHAYPQASALAFDVSPVAVDYTTKNANKFGLADRIEVVVSDVFSALDSLPSWQCEFDLIISNPPYIRLDEKLELARDVIEFEPHLALFCPDDGLSFHRRIVTEGLSRLAPDGGIVLELASESGASIVAFAQNKLAECQASVLPDYSGHDRVFCLTREKWPEEFSGLHGANRASKEEQG
ncbi:MAG: release factor glutamine methyltransferase [Planctomycetota bacterium]|jgi:release factor glutamine methyltransferase